MLFFPSSGASEPAGTSPGADYIAADRLGYIADLAGELGAMARAAGREGLAALLDQAAGEARRELVPPTVNAVSEAGVA